MKQTGRKKSIYIITAIALVLSLVLPTLGCTAADTEPNEGGNATSDTSLEIELLEDDGTGLSDKDYTITDKPLRLEDDRFILEVPEGVYVPGTVEQNINTVLDAIEETTGLSFFGGGSSDPIVITVARSNPSGRTDCKQESGDAYAIGDYGIEISPFDLIIPAGQGWTMTHELLHVLNSRQGGSLLAKPLCEGFTTYWTQKIIEKGRYPSIFNGYGNYSFYEHDSDLNAQTAEQLFIASDEDGWEGYLYGFRLMHYMDECGYIEQHMELCRENADVGDMTCEQAAPLLKEKFGDDFFERFGEWFEKNSDMFTNGSFTQDFTAFDTFDVYPMIAAWDMYEPLNFTYSGSITLDFTKGSEYATEYLGRTVTGDLVVMLSADGDSVATFLDADGKELRKVKLPGAPQTLTVENAVKIVVEGDGKLVHCEPIFEDMIGPAA